MKKSALKTPPAVDRFASKPANMDEPPRVDRTGGRYGTGMIRGVSLCSRGEALGHYMWIDSEFLDQITAAANGKAKRLKSRFTHPDLCSDGMGKALGTIENVSRIGDQVFGDLHFYAAAHDAPDGDLAVYVMQLADEDPENFGTSIVFAHDREAESKFLTDHGAKQAVDDDGWTYWDMTDFESPDPLNVDKLPHARLSELRACDVVDDPAANPNGLFHRPNSMLADATGLLDFVFGKSTKIPALSAFGADIAPERVREFVNSYLAGSGLSITKEKTKMAKGKTQLADSPEEPKKADPETPADPKPPEDCGGKTKCGDEEPDPETPADPKPEETPAKETSQSEKADLAKFCEVFGHEAGAKYFLEGVSFEAAQTKHIAALTAELKAANEKLAAFAKSGVDPVPFSAAKDPARDKSNAPQQNQHDPSLSNRDAFAQAIATPSKN